MQQDLSPGTSEPPVDSGLAAFAQILAMHRIVADPAELRHSLGHANPVAASDLLRLAKRIEGVRARATTADFERLRRLPMPVMASGTEGWFVIGRDGILADAADHEPTLGTGGHRRHGKASQSLEIRGRGAGADAFDPLCQA